MIHPNPRSVLRPEYLGHMPVSAVSNVPSSRVMDRRVNTNTAPVYSVNNPCPIRRKTYRQQNHPYLRHVRNMVSRSLVCHSVPQANGHAQDHPALRDCMATVPKKVVMSPVSDNSTSPSNHSYASRTSFNSFGNVSQRYTDSPLKSGRDDFTGPKSYTHGQAEQLRRSRESNTFALIDAQLSKPPLSQVRYMYLQNRSGGSGVNGSAARTTKKANLSVVHTVVRFRVRDYLIQAREHVKRLLDTLFRNIYDDYDTSSRDPLASKLFGFSRSCTPECQYCVELDYYSSRTQQFCRSHSCSNVRERSQPPFVQSETVKLSSIKSEPSFCSVPELPGSAVPLPDSNHSESIDDDATLPMVVSDIKPEPNELPVSCSPTLAPAMADQSLESLLPSYHMSNDPFDIKPSKRTRLDSTTLLIANDFDNYDWSAEDINLGPFGDDNVDLQNILTDPLPIKFDDQYLDSVCDSDFLHQFNNDKHSGLLTAGTP